ncbi:lysylphosphatidylglycerol synthase transmembrane domain-containing protein [Saliphagus sp. LR7]|uniref:lysylphosphatidylglycerol synthase transmembrane domain-containing protein n=1 Tax=Saliphagus sp. LR7 TaxID=2282654 RepID=UPI000DF7FB8B|nr:lysylphosphatidylglycerol synthase transmembrane domain-containing protein [Saliphagus sp. LR7]
MTLPDLRTAGRVAVSLVLLGAVVATVGVETVLEGLAELRPTALGAALGLAVLNVAISAYKWGLLLRIKGIDLPFRTLLAYYYVGQFFNAFLPTTVGGDGVRVYSLHAHHDAGPDAVSSVVMERLTGLLTVLAIGGVATAVVADRLPPVVSGTVLLALPAGAAVAGVLFTGTGRGVLERTLFRVSRFDLGDRLAGVYDAIHDYRGAGRALVPVVVLSLVFRLVLVVNNYVVAVGLGMEVSFVYFLAFVPLVELLLFVPVSIQGFGVRETAYVYLFGAVGAPAGAALTLGIAMQLVLGVFNNLLGGLVYLRGSYSR